MVRRSFEEALLSVRLTKRRAFDALRRQRRRLRGEVAFPKVFCIGQGKTGTTSMERALREMGYHMGDQLEATLIYAADHHAGRFDRLIAFCRRFEAFQDLPFSAPGTFRALDRAFPGSKFVLTMRDSSEQWCDSMIRFQSKRLAAGRMPTYADLERARYIRTGYSTHFIRLYGTTCEDPFNRERLIASYLAHNREVMEHFAGRPDDLLVLNVAEPGAMARLAGFLGRTTARTEFPWENRT